jgi:hypothetical protein
MSVIFRSEESKDIRIRIGTWEESNLVRVGLETRTAGESRIRQSLELTKEQIRELLALEEECNRDADSF